MAATVDLSIFGKQAPAQSRSGSPPQAIVQSGTLTDSFGRTIRDLRLSITDRCNFRCTYCMEPGVRFLGDAELLTLEERLLLVRACAHLGVRRVRLTGGEPTVHPDLEGTIHGVASVEGIEDVSITTNGSLCTMDSLVRWRMAGLNRITFSLDSLRPSVFASLSRSNLAPDRIVESIRWAIRAGLNPVKVNAVVMRGVNEDDVEPLVRLAVELQVEVRFIEFMPLDSGRQWSPDRLVPADEILALASNPFGPLVPRQRDDASQTSQDYDIPGQQNARIGIIAPVTRSFCGACSRLRITADGRVRPCLFSHDEADLRTPLRRGRNHAETINAVSEFLVQAVWRKQSGHGINTSEFRPPVRPMSAIGG